MNAILFADSYGGARLLDGGLNDAVFTAPSGGSVVVANPALLRDTVAARQAVVSYAGLPRVASGANLGYFGPLRISITGKQWAWSGNGWALVNTSLPARTRVEQAWGTTPGAPVAAGGPFLEPMPGVQRNLVFSPAAPFSGYLGGNFGATSLTLQIDLYLPFGTGSFAIGRLFIGHIVTLSQYLLSSRSHGMVDYAPEGTALSGTGARRSRGVARKRTITLEPDFPRPTVSGFFTDFELPLLLDLIGVNSHVLVYGPTAADTALGDGPECIYGVLRPSLEVTARPADRQSTVLQFLETF